MTEPGAPATPQVSSDVWTVPNVLSMLRLVAVPLFGWLIVAEHDGWALLVLMLSGFTDYLDGKIARRFGLVSRLGQMLDPLADRLYILSTLLGLGWRDIIPWWLVVALIGRDVLMAALGPVLRHYRLPLPAVHFVGKAATFNLLYAFPLLLLGDGSGTLAEIARPLGWAFAWWGTGLYWVAGLLYIRQVGQMVSRARDRP